MKKGLLTVDEWLNSPGITIEEMAIYMAEVVEVYAQIGCLGRSDNDQQSFAE